MEEYKGMSREERAKKMEEDFNKIAKEFGFKTVM